MANRDLVEAQATQAINDTYSEHIVMDPASPDVGKVADTDYAKHLAKIEDGKRAEGLEIGELEKALKEEITNNMQELAARKVSQNQGGKYPDAQEYLHNEGINPVNKPLSEEKYNEINNS